MEEDDNRILVDDGQFLLLMEVEAHDVGSYLCELTNSLGTQRRRVVLELQEGSNEVFFSRMWKMRSVFFRFF